MSIHDYIRLSADARIRGFKETSREDRTIMQPVIFRDLKWSLHSAEMKLIEECEKHVHKEGCGKHCPYCAEDNLIDDYCYLWDIRERIDQIQGIIEDLEDYMEKENKKCSEN